VRVVWQYGLWTAISTLLLEVPEHDQTFAILGNTDALSASGPGPGNPSAPILL
jgi:hypothetical protein